MLVAIEKSFVMEKGRQKINGGWWLNNKAFAGGMFYYRGDKN